MFDEVVKSVRSYMYEKSSSPLAGSFVLSWLAWNYKFLLVVFAGESVIEKYKIIGEILYASDLQLYGYGMLFPLITALGYIYMYPYPALKVFEFSKAHQKILNDKKQEMEDERLLTVEEGREIRKEFYKREEELLREIERKDSTIKRLNGQVESHVVVESTAPDETVEDKEQKSKKSPPNYQTENIALYEEQKNILAFMGISQTGESAEVSYEDILVGLQNLSALELDYHLDALLADGLIQNFSYSGHGDKMVSLSANGRAFVVENVL